MINISDEIVNVDELVRATGRKAGELELELSSVELNKGSMSLNILFKLNFVVPRSIEMQIKRRLRASLPGIRNINLSYAYSGMRESPRVREEEPSGGGYGERGRGSYRRKDSYEPVSTNSSGETIILGKDFTDIPISYDEAISRIGDKGLVTVEGEVFSTDSKPIKNGRVIYSMCIANHSRTMPVKMFLDEKKLADFNSSLGKGDWVRVRGSAEFDTFDHTNVIMGRAVKKVNRDLRKDTYHAGKRVELHIHSKMSDNDGFNEIADIVNTAAYWGQPAVAITDHGVVQAFPDAAKTAGKLAKAGKSIKVIYGLEGYLYPDDGCIGPDGEIDIKKNRTYHIILLAKNQTGLKNLYKLVSCSHIDYFYKRPRIPRSVLESHREGLIVGSACEAGEVYQAVLRNEPDDKLLEIADYYDYLEIQPLGNNQFMINEGMVSGREDLIRNNLRIIELGDRLGKLTVATTDSHYPDKESSIYRNIIMAGIGFKDTESDALYMRTTDEMMEEFSYLGDRAEEIVITNTNRIADMIDEDIRPVPKGKFPPKIEGAEEKLRKSCYDRCKSIYGDPIPKEIKERLDTELNSIISNGYAVMYVAAQMLVGKSMDDGYLVGSRGSVGSSFAATMAGITEVNPLPPHYVCPECKYHEFTKELDKYDCGFDMPEKACPVCGTRLHKDGLNIPFATFLGFKGDKEPDIDLNFAGEYQPIAHKYVGEIFGEKNVFKAGTVATVAEKTAYGYVKHFVDEKGIPASKSDIDYLTLGCSGVKRTTGQHPGGIIVVPDDHEIYEFCPIQKPANKRDVDVITTHFDYHKIDENLLKLDILGHDVPQLIRHLQNMTGVEPMKIPLDDPKTISIFTSLDALEIKNPDYRFTHGTYGIPEFGTHFTRQMLDDIKPTTVSALIKMSGFSHGTNVWTGNAQDLIRQGIATVDEVISARDDIMNYLILKGIDNSSAFKIMETVRKNRELSEDDLKLMKEHGVPDWYIWSCKTLEYLFPRAHASAYVMMSIRMAWFKVYYPPEFYAAYFTSKVDNFDADVINGGIPAVENQMREIEELGNSATAKQKEQLIVYEMMYEMFSRGYEFLEPSLEKSDPTAFYVVDGKVQLPFLAISGVGRTAAVSLKDEYNKKDFISVEDVKSRTKLSQTNIDDLKRHGMFKALPESAQVSIFEI